ncbi:sigma factor [Paraburkholderia youngii]|uniref:sigma factor n=1 Tax=Paraburkholderia youngii TaxID=2782701 RepID=UPI003D213E99
MSASSHGTPEVVARFQPLVRHIALQLHSKLRVSSVDLGDLYQAGAMGLQDALTRYDGSAAADLGVHVGVRVRGAMIDMLRDQDVRRAQ